MPIEQGSFHRRSHTPRSRSAPTASSPALLRRTLRWTLRGHAIRGFAFAAWLVAVDCGAHDELVMPNGPLSGESALRVSPVFDVVTPGTVRVFRAWLVTATGDSTAVAATWRATGGVIEPDGRYVAPAGPGDYLVIASLSDVRLADTARVTVRSVTARVVLSPSSLALPRDASTTIAITLHDADGDPVSNPVRWRAVDPTIAAVVGGSGLLTANGEGETIVVAESDAASDSVRVVVTAPTARAWPNEPLGFRSESEQPWSLLGTLSWILQFGTAAIGVDFAAPLSPPGVLEIVYPTGFQGGSAPGTVVYEFNPLVRGMYAGIWWKPSDPWQGHESNVNKVEFLFADPGAQWSLTMYGTPGGPYELRVGPQVKGHAPDWLVPNRARVPVALGEWHRIEWLVLKDAVPVSPPTGVMRWWLDGTLIGDYADIPMPANLMGAYKLSPTWGGIGDTKRQTDRFLVDHIRISVP